jgi:hypothetical protein
MDNMMNLNAKRISHRVWLAVAVVFGLAYLAPAASAGPMQCGVDSLAAYTVSGFTCTLGAYTIQDFTFSSSGSNLLTSDLIVVDPTQSTPTQISFQFYGVDNTPFSVPTGQSAEYVFQYYMDPILSPIIGATLDLGPNDPVTLTGEYCGNGNLYSAPNNNPEVEPTCIGTNPNGIYPAKTQLVGTGAPASTSFTFPINVSTLDTRLILDLTGPASVTSFGSIANVTGGGPDFSNPSQVPEPSSALWVVPGMLGLAWFRQRRKQRVSAAQ